MCSPTSRHACSSWKGIWAFPLFIREGKRLHLSPTGKVLLDYAERLLDLAQEARIAVRDNTPRGPLRLGAMESTAAIRLPGPLSEFHRRYPDVKLDLSTRSIAEPTEQVLSGALDAALVAEPVSGNFEKAAIYDEELTLIAPAGHAPIRSPRDVEADTMLAFEPGCPYRLRLAMVCPCRRFARTHRRDVVMARHYRLRHRAHGNCDPAEGRSDDLPAEEFSEPAPASPRAQTRTNCARLAQGRTVSENFRIERGSQP